MKKQPRKPKPQTWKRWAVIYDDDTFYRHFYSSRAEATREWGSSIKWGYRIARVTITEERGRANGV